jgi:hypothetical protein
MDKHTNTRIGRDVREKPKGGALLTRGRAVLSRVAVLE